MLLSLEELGSFAVRYGDTTKGRTCPSCTANCKSHASKNKLVNLFLITSILKKFPAFMRYDDSVYIHGQAFGSDIFIAFLYDNFLAEMRGHLILVLSLKANF